MLLFQVLPIVIGANASFRDWALYNPKKIWVGFSHYYAVLSPIRRSSTSCCRTPSCS